MNTLIISPRCQGKNAKQKTIEIPGVSKVNKSTLSGFAFAQFGLKLHVIQLRPDPSSPTAPHPSATSFSLVLRSALLSASEGARVLSLSKDEGRPQASSSPRPSFETRAQARAPQDEVQE